MYFTNTEIPAPAVSTPTEIKGTWKGLQPLNFFHTNSQFLETWTVWLRLSKLLWRINFLVVNYFPRKDGDQILNCLYWMCRSGRRKQNLLCCGISLPYVDYLRNISWATMKSFICWFFLGLYSISIGLTKSLSWDHKICCLWERCSACQ